MLMVTIIRMVHVVVTRMTKRALLTVDGGDGGGNGDDSDHCNDYDEDSGGDN